MHRPALIGPLDVDPDLGVAVDPDRDECLPDKLRHQRPLELAGVERVTAARDVPLAAPEARQGLAPILAIRDELPAARVDHGQPHLRLLEHHVEQTQLGSELLPLGRLPSEQEGLWVLPFATDFE